MTRDYTHLPTAWDHMQANDEADEANNPTEYKEDQSGGEHSRSSVIHQGDPAGAENNTHETDGEPSPPDAMMKFWKFLGDEHHARASQTVLQILILLMTLGIALIYAAQLGQMIESNRISRDSFQSVQRAFLTCQDVTPRRFAQIEAGTRRETWLFSAPCENSGTTPANITAQAFWVDVAASGPTEEEFLKLLPLAQVSEVGPKSVHHIGNVSIREQDIFGRMLAEDIEKERPTTKEHPLPLVFWGWVTYRDVFPDTKLHLTEFCKQSVLIEVHPADPQIPYEWGWSECSAHNCADEYCSDYQTIVKLSKP